MQDRDRGQAYTLEGVISAILIASALVLGIQAVNITPFADEGPQSGTDLRTQVEDSLEIAQDRDGLKTAVSCLGPDSSEPSPGIIDTESNTTFGAVLNQTLSNVVGNKYVVFVDYPNETGVVKQLALGSDTIASGSSVTVTKQVTLFDSDPVYELDPDEAECLPDGTLGGVNPNDIYLSDQSPGDELYSVVQIRVIVWQQ